MSRLDDRIKEHGIPKIPYYPSSKTVLVYRLPPEEKSAGGIIFAQTDQDTRYHGVLLAAGLGALDHMADHLIEIGDIVWFGRYAGSDAKTERQATERSSVICQMKVEDILGSEDAIERVKGYDIVRDDGCDTCKRDRQFHYVPKNTKRKAA